jgi:hypothetical protein
MTSNASWNFGTVYQGPPTFKFRGWFVNDEHGLLGWHHIAGQPNRIEPDIWARIFETICRLRGNVYTLIDYGATPDTGSLKLANDRGLYITGAHDQVLISNSAYEWNKYSKEKYGSVLPFHWTTHSKEIVSFWTDEGVMRHRNDLAIWTLGLRGQGDVDFYDGDSEAPKSMEDRARITNKAVQIEENLVRENLPPGSKPLFMTALRGGAI